MKYFKVTQKDWENFILGKRKYIITTDEPCKGYVKCIVPNGVIAQLFVTDIVSFITSVGSVYIVTAEVEQVCL